LTAAQHAELRAGLEEDLRRLVFGTGSRGGAGVITAEVLEDLEPRARRRGLQLLDALRRLDAGSFGICTGCEAPISYVRLSVIPETTVCVECSGARELLLRA
jgi:RNA polymerase-binding transcription factor DksA